MEPITKDSLKKVDIKSLALDKNKFGALTFDISFPILEKLQKLFVDFEDFDYKNQLTLSEVNQIESYKTTFANNLQRLASFDPGNDSSFNKNVRDSFENEIKNFNDNVAVTLRAMYSYLRQEADIKSRSGKDIQKEVISAQKESKKLVEELKKELETIKSKKTEYEVVKGQVATEKFSKYFADQAENYKKLGKRWLIVQILFFIIILALIIGNIYIFLGKSINFDTNVLLQYGIAKLVLLSVLSYGLGFASKNYHICAQQEAVNLHRKTAADTMNDLIAANPDKADVRAEVISQASEAMFKHMPVGHITKSESSSGPMLEIVEKVFKK